MTQTSAQDHRVLFVSIKCLSPLLPFLLLFSLSPSLSTQSVSDYHLSISLSVCLPACLFIYHLSLPISYLPSVFPICLLSSPSSLTVSH